VRCTTPTSSAVDQPNISMPAARFQCADHAVVGRQREVVGAQGGEARQREVESAVEVDEFVPMKVIDQRPHRHLEDVPDHQDHDGRNAVRQHVVARMARQRRRRQDIHHVAEHQLRHDLDHAGRDDHQHADAEQPCVGKHLTPPSACRAGDRR
jgi:hypothetical protein